VAAVNSNGQRLNQLIEVYVDNSFRIMMGNEVAGVGRWNYNPASEKLLHAASSGPGRRLREIPARERLTDEQWQRYAVTLDLATRTR
jgi:hypothetical protein